MNTTPPPAARPVNRPARRGGVLLIILSAVALVFGVFSALFAVLLPELEKNPDMAASLKQLHEQFPMDIRELITLTAVMFGVYGIVSLVIGIGLIGGRRRWVIAGLVFTIGITLFMALNTLSAIGLGVGGFFPLMLVVAHGLVAYWLLGGLNAASATPDDASRPQQLVQIHAAASAPQPRRPMQAYYETLPLASGTSRTERSANTVPSPGAPGEG